MICINMMKSICIRLYITPDNVATLERIQKAKLKDDVLILTHF